MRPVRYVVDPIVVVARFGKLEALPRRARAVMDLLLESGRAELSMGDIQEILLAGRPRLGSSHHPWRVFKHHEDRLVEDGLLSREEVSATRLVRE